MGGHAATCLPPNLKGTGKMHAAIDPHTNQVITVLDYRRLDEDDRPTELRCPGHAPNQTLCSATVYPCALTSTKRAPYFRVEDLTDHVDGCTDIIGDLAPISRDDPYLVGIKGAQGPTGPRRVISVVLNARHSNTPTSKGDANSSQPNTRRVGHHRAPAPTEEATPTRIRAGLRKIANDHAMNVYWPTDTVRLVKGREGKGTVATRIITAKRLIEAPFEDGPLITYGSIASISPKQSDGAHFVRLRLPDGRPTSTFIVIRREHVEIVQHSVNFDDVIHDPTSWQIVVLGTIRTSSNGNKYLVPHDEYSVEFELAPSVESLT